MLRAHVAKPPLLSLLCTACLSVQYLEELEALEQSNGAAALPGKRPLTPAEQAAAGGVQVEPSNTPAFR